MVKPAGETGEFKSTEARRWSIRPVSGRQSAGGGPRLGLPPRSSRTTRRLEGGWRAVRVDLSGPLGADTVDQVQTADRGTKSASTT